MKRFYLFTEKGITGRYYCGNVYEALPSDSIRVDGERMDFSFAEEIGRCKSFSTRKEANTFSAMEFNSMHEANEYARNAMREEDGY